MKLYSILLAILISIPCMATTTVTGNIKTLGTASVTSNAYVRFWLRGCGGNQPRVNGTAVISPAQGGVFFFDVVANSSGVVSGTLYSTRDAAGTGNGEIECGGSFTAAWYGMQVFFGGKGGPEVSIVAKNGSSIDISNITPITTNPVLVAPTGDSTYIRLDGGNGAITGSAAASLGIVSKTPSATQTITGYPLNLNNVLFTLTGTSEMDGPVGLTTPNVGFFTSAGIGTSSPVTLTKSTTPPTTGFLDINAGVHTNSSIVVDSGVIQVNADEAYISLKDGGHLIAVQAGPRAKESTITSTSITSNVLTVTGVQLSAFIAADVVYISGTKESFLNGQTCTVATSNGTTQFTCPFTHANYTNASDTGEAVTGFLLADSTLTLPDMAGGTSTPNSGFLLGSTVATLVSSPGHCMFFDSSKGVVNDSGFTCNSNIGFPVNTRSIQWSNGGNSISLTSAASSGSRTATLPDATGNVLLSSTAEIITTCAVLTVTAAQNGWCSFFNTVPITVTRVMVSVQTAAAGCSTSPQFGVRGTAATVTLANGNGVQDSGALSVNIPAGSQQSIGVANVDAGCGTQPANAMVTVQYHMQ